MIDPQMVALSMVATFVYVGLRALQQLNVVHGHYVRIFPTSLGMGVGDVLLVLIIIKTQTIWMGLFNGVAGALGCYAAMYLTRRWK